MYWGQIAIAAVSAISAIWFTIQDGYSVGTTVAVALIVYVCVRWAIAWVYRVRYWYNRGTQGIYYERCPTCDARRYRTRGDWILRCHTCRWTSGWPVLKWITRSVPSIQLRRTVVGPKLLVVILATVLIASGMSAGITMSSLNSVAGESALADGSTSAPGLNTTHSSQPDATSSPRTQSSPQTTTESDDVKLNITKIERLVWIYTNVERSQHGLSNVSYAPRIASVARDHSENMAKHDYIGHTEPNGETGEERYADVCDYTGSGYTFGENAASAYYKERFVAWGTDQTVYLTTEQEVAKYLVNGWMRSDGHRANILNEEWTELGVGIAVSGNKIYASQTFC